MFKHSVRVPRLYKVAAKIAKEVNEGKGSIKQLVYEAKHSNIKAIYALVVHVYQQTDALAKLLKKSKLLIKEPRLDQWLAKVLITELLWGKKRLPGQSKPETTILAYEQIFKAHLSDVSNNDEVEELEQVYKPRYVRVNTLKISVNEAIEIFRNEGWTLKRFTKSGDYFGFLEAVRNLQPEEFMIDFHIPYLLIFPPKTQFYKNALYKNGSIILQDKASCLPIHILNPEPASTVLDMCASPGMKTTQCASLMKDTGKIYAVEIGKNRYATLNQIVESSAASCVETINADVLTLTGEQYPDVKYITVDPSCSGSGITDRVELGRREMDQHKNRLEKLAGFQIKTLRHALTRFPKAKRVVYSTCSVYPEENEDVVRQVLETCKTFKLVSAKQLVKENWLNFGAAEFGDIGNYCLYARPDIDLTSGFFVAVFERLQKGEKNPFLNEKLYSTRLQQHRPKKEVNAEETNGNEPPKKTKKKNKRKGGQDRDSQKDAGLPVFDNEEENVGLKEEGNGILKEEGNKKKNNKRKKSLSEEVEFQHDSNKQIESTESPKKKKKDQGNDSWLEDLIKEEIRDQEAPALKEIKSEGKKKQKKNKQDASQINKSVEYNNEEQTTDDVSVKKKKKSKKQEFA